MGKGTERKTEPFACSHPPPSPTGTGATVPAASPASLSLSVRTSRLTSDDGVLGSFLLFSFLPQTKAALSAVELYRQKHRVECPFPFTAPLDPKSKLRRVSSLPLLCRTSFASQNKSSNRNLRAAAATYQAPQMDLSGNGKPGIKRRTAFDPTGQGKASLATRIVYQPIRDYTTAADMGTSHCQLSNLQSGPVAADRSGNVWHPTDENSLEKGLPR